LQIALQVFDGGVSGYMDKYRNERGRIETRYIEGRNENEDDFFKEYNNNI
jgi:hypothetical protein